MSLPTFITYLPLLWFCATASPAGGNGAASQHVIAGSDWSPNNRYPYQDDFSSAAYKLIDTYDGTNWLSKFDVQAVSHPSQVLCSY
jgi:hypothetical protein